ncbi:MAG: TonB-dependent receptor plug domain-containing protein [Bacteroidota bacterium]
MHRLVVCAVLAFVLGAPSVAAQSRPASADSLAEADTLKRYDLQEIAIQGTERVDGRIATVQRVTLAVLKQEAAPSVAEVAHHVPGAHTLTNSRGETLLYLRGAGERQTALFFDGALLNIPWDNRLDLSAVPAGLVGGLTVAKGASAVEYGANVLGGAVNLTSPALDGDGRYTELDVLYGTQSTVQANATHYGRSGRFGYAGLLSATRQSGLPLAQDADLAFSQTDDALRTNTDRRMVSGLIRGTYDFERGPQIGFTLLHVDATQGVAPEGHVPTDEARLWRYPLWRYTMGIASAQGRWGATTWKATSWLSAFDQTIESHGSLAYDAPLERQDDADRTAGLRVTAARPLGPGTLRLALNGLTSVHRQRDQEVAAEAIAPELEYQQHLASLGGSYTHPLGRGWQATLGGSYDVMGLPQTGDKPARDPFTALSVIGGVRYASPVTGWRAHASVGRKTRFPTMRELFGEALNRFLVNPTLAPESAWLAEVGVGLERGLFQIEAVPFLTVTANTIDQRSVTVGAQRLRQRINLDGSYVLGIEAVARTRFARYWSLGGHLTAMRARQRSAESLRLSETPAAVGTLTLRYTSPKGLDALVAARHRGTAVSLDPGNCLVTLPATTTFDARLGYRLLRSAERSAEVFVRGDNLANVAPQYQLGLPGPGRTVRAGLTVSF